MVVDHPTTGDTATDAPEPHDELRRNYSGPEVAAEVTSELTDIPSPEDYRAAVDAKYREHAIETGCARVREIEQNEITPAMRRIEAADPTRHLVGFENRLKSEERISEKVESIVSEQPELTYQDAFAMVKDAIRFTLQYPEEKYAEGVRADLSRFEGEGFKLVDLRNTWSSQEYKGINTRWKAAESGQLFEVQFHTQASYQAKQETHSAYEKLRSSGTSRAEQEELHQYQCEISARVRTPPGAIDLENR